MRILYLGLRPKSGTFHYPVIRTEFCGHLEEALFLWPQFTHVIFTSQTTAAYWPGPWNKPTIAIGTPTAEALALKGVKVLTAPFATQEGILELIRDIPGYFFLPHSRLARPWLTDSMKQLGIPFYAVELYTICFQSLEPVPNLDDFDEIIFTSPSTVEGFLRIYGRLPQGKRLYQLS